MLKPAISSLRAESKKVNAHTLTQKITYLLLLIALTFTLGIRLWALNKGLDIWDEGYYLLGYQPLQERLNVISAFHTIIYRLFGWMHPDIGAYRLIALLLTMVASSIFTLGFWTWLQKIYKRENLFFGLKFTLLLFVFGGFVLDYSKHRSISYNTLNNFVNLVQSSLVLLALSQEQKAVLRTLKLKFLWLVVGCLMTFQFLNKPPSALSFFCLLTVVLFLYYRNINFRFFSTVYGFLALGGLLGFLIYFAFFQDFSQYINLFSGNLSTNFLEEKDPSIIGPLLPFLEQWRRLLGEFKLLIPQSHGLLWFYLIVFLLATLYFSTQYLKSKKNRYLYWILVFGFVIDSCYRFQNLLIPPFYNTALIVIASIALLLVVLSAIFWDDIWLRMLNISGTDRFWKNVSVCIFLFWLPCIASVGTSTSPLTMASRNIVPWLALLVLLLINIERNRDVKPFVSLFTLSFITWLLVVITYLHLYKPHRLVAPLYNQTETLSFAQPHIQSLRVDPETKEFFENLNILIQKADFEVGDPIIGLYDLAGAVYALGGVSPGEPTYFGLELKRFLNRNCNNLMISTVDKSKAVLITSETIDPKTLDCLQEAGIDFPNGYMKVGEVFNPYSKVSDYREDVVSVWRAKPE